MRDSDYVTQRQFKEKSEGTGCVIALMSFFVGFLLLFVTIAAFARMDAIEGQLGVKCDAPGISFWRYECVEATPDAD